MSSVQEVMNNGENSCASPSVDSPLGPILLNKVAIITGSSSGFGAETARLFAHCGANVVVTGRDEEATNKVGEECKAVAETMGYKDLKFPVVVGDLSSEEFCKKLIKTAIDTFDRLDVLVNNAGISQRDSMLNPDLEVFDKILAVNFRAVYILTSLAVPHLIKNKGNIVNVSSVTSVTISTTSISYACLKAALDHFTRNVAAELGPHQVRVNAVNPGFVPTNLTRSYNFPSEEAVRKMCEDRAKKHALERFGHPEEVASVIAFIASDQASFVTGDIIVVDGGFAVKGPGAPAATK